MPRINLLPHREHERKRRRREFGVAAIVAFLAGAVVAGGAKVVYSGWIDAQNEKNNVLKKEIVKLDAEIADIQDLENRKQRLVARMEIIEKLQRKRPEIVHQFDELVHTVPDGVYLSSIKQSGNKLELKGVAQSSTRVSTFMRNIDSSVCGCGQPERCRWSRRPRTRPPADRISPSSPIRWASISRKAARIR